MAIDGTYHQLLPCGAQLAGQYLPRRRIVAVNITFVGGLANEPEDQLGVAQLTEDVLDKGTQKYTAEQLADTFDAIGARRSSTTGRETVSFGCIALADFFERVMELHSEMLCRPTFPADQCKISQELSLQELDAMEDDPMDLLQKIARRQSLGPIFGRHPLGERGALERLGRAQIVEYWRTNLVSRRMQVSIVGPIEAARAADVVERFFCPLSRGEPSVTDLISAGFPHSGTTHYTKKLEQVYMALSWPGATRQAEDWPAEAVALNVLSGGMSSRLFTEVREKQGLVYWVSAWPDYLRSTGLLSMGASTTPQKSRQTYETLLREIDRLGEDLTQGELDRAKRLITARRQTRGELTKIRAGELAEDLFFFGAPRDREAETARVEKVTIADIQSYLKAHPRTNENLCVATVGTQEGSQVVGCR